MPKKGHADGETIKIAVVTSISGENKPWGTDQLEGCKLAVDEVNAAGGIQGKKVEIVEGDTASKPDQAKLAAEKVLGTNVLGIVGEVSSGNTIQIAKSAFDKGVPVIFFFTGFHPDYHQVTDSPDRINTGKAARVARLAFMTAWTVANENKHYKIVKSAPGKD